MGIQNMRISLLSLFRALLIVTGWGTTAAMATVYDVGPELSYTSIGSVPWESLGAGDQVNIHWRAEPYREKWVIGRSGTEESPIVVRGVANAEGDLPVISGENATTRQALNYTNEERGLIKVGSANIPSVPDDTVPKYIVIENLELRSARYPYNFTGDSGQSAIYTNNAASIYVEKAQNLTIRNCIIHDSGNGIFVGAFNGMTRDILIEHNHIYDNGIVDSIYQHNTYTEALNITYQYNHMGPLRTGTKGNNLKDRSAGLTVRYNWIENGNRQLDLVDSSTLADSSNYRETYVYANILLEADDLGNSQIVHYGGDSGTENNYRKGTLYFFNNSLISRRSGNTTVLRLSTDDETAEMFNNILYTTATGNRLALVASSGYLNLSHNWIKAGFSTSHSSYDISQLSDDETTITGSEPGFTDPGADDFSLLVTSPARDSGITVDAAGVSGHPLDLQYVVHQKVKERTPDGALDRGAFEYAVPVDPGDVDGGGDVGLHDAIISLQVASGQLPLPLRADADVDGDGRIGLAEALFVITSLAEPEEEYVSIPLQSTIDHVQPMTGIVFWDDSEHNTSDAISLEYKYVGYDTIVGADGSYNWSSFESMLNGIAARGHQALVRFYFVYPGAETTVPLSIKNLSGYKETSGISEGENTWFADWASLDLQNFVLEFFTRFSARYDDDPRLAFLQVGFGLWGEYHIYDGPMTLGATFPSRAFQTTFLQHMDVSFGDLKWSISIDAADTETYSPFANETLFDLQFGLFDDSFLHADHDDYNRDCFLLFSYGERSRSNPMGGELNYYTTADQRDALDPTGPHGTSFESLATQYNISYMIGNDQPEYQTLTRIKAASMATGYRFQITALETKNGASRGTISNQGIAPIYYDAYVAVNGVRSSESLKGLQPGESLDFEVAAGVANPIVTIECDRMVAGQEIEFEADL